MTTSDDIAGSFARQAEAAGALGSPFTAALCRRLPAALPRDTAFGARVLGWTGRPWADALPLRVCGALHALARSGRDPALATAWPPDPQGDPLPAAAAAIRAHDAWLLPWLDGPPQTNETGRSAILLGGALHLAARLGMPLETLEIGASAGLNMAFDRYRYELGGGRAWGDPAAPVRIACDWRGTPPPLDAPLDVAARAGVDVRPADPDDPEARARMMAYVWPDQTERLARLDAALVLAAAAPWRVERADAGAWLDARLARPQPSGRVRVVLHSIVWQYLSRETKARIARALADAAARATEAAPLAWLRMEPDAEPGSAAMTLTVWPGGADETLGRADFHGRSADWRG